MIRKDNAYYAFVFICVFLTLIACFLIFQEEERINSDEYPIGSEKLDINELKMDTEASRTMNQRKIDKSTNSMGFCDDEWRQMKPNNTYRIVAIGDSMTRGMFIRNNMTWPEQLEKKLNNKKNMKKYEILNMGRVGIPIQDKYEIFKNISFKYNPDMLILQYYNDDTWPKDLRERWEVKWGEYEEGEYEFPEAVKKIIKEENYSEVSISEMIRYIELKKYFNNKDPKKIWERHTKSYFEKFTTTASERNISFLVISWDIPSWKIDKMSKTSNEFGFYFHDLSGVLPFDRSKYRFPDGHLTPYGYGVVANKTYEILGENILSKKLNN